MIFLSRCLYFFIQIFDSAELSNGYPIPFASLLLGLCLAAPRAMCCHPQRKSQLCKRTEGESCHVLMRPVTQIMSSSLDWCQIIISRPAYAFLIQLLRNQSYQYGKGNRLLGPWKHNLKLYWRGNCWLFPGSSSLWFKVTPQKDKLFG